MKTFFSGRVFGVYAWGACCLIAMTFLTTGRLAGQEKGQGNYVVQASTKLSTLINKANNDRYVLQDGFSTGGAWIKQSADKWVPIYTVQLTEGRKYRFLAAGDNDTKDLDLEIQDSTGKTLASDEDIAATAVVDFAPSVSGRYTVRLRLFDSQNEVPCFCFVAVMVKD